MIVSLRTNLTPEQFEMMSGTRGVELVDGDLKELNMGAESSYVSGELMFLIGKVIRAGNLGHIFPPDAMYQCFPLKPKSVRKPDVSFVRSGRFPNNRPPRGIIYLVPDLVVEVISPNDTYYDVEDKLNDYLLVKVPLIWVVNPDCRSVHTYLADGTVRRYTAEEELTGEPLFPGFRVRVADLFPAPLPTPSVESA